MKFVSITGKDHFEEHPIDNDAIEYAARITAEAHTIINEDDPWVVSVRDPDAIPDKDLKMAEKIVQAELPEPGTI